MCVRACICACMHACVCVRVCVRVCELIMNDASTYYWSLKGQRSATGLLCRRTPFIKPRKCNTCFHKVHG